MPQGLKLVDESGQPLSGGLRLVDEGGQPLESSVEAKTARIQSGLATQTQYPSAQERGLPTSADLRSPLQRLFAAITNPTENSPIPVDYQIFPPALTPGAPGTEAMSFGQQLMHSPAAETISGMRQAYKNWRYGPEANQIAQKINASGILNQAKAKDIAPDLAQDPELVSASAKQFPQKLFQKFQAAGENVNQVEAAIPDQTPVLRTKLVNGLEDVKARFDRAGATDAVNAIQKQIDLIEKVPASEPSGGVISWKDFIANKRRLGNDLDKLGVFDRILRGTASEKDYALKQVYGQYMGATELMQDVPGVSQALVQANQKFATLHDAMEAAGLDFKDGVKISTYGKVPSPLLIKLIKAGALVGLGGAAASAYRRISSASNILGGP